jgi:hypothetical protein
MTRPFLPSFSKRDDNSGFRKEELIEVAEAVWNFAVDAGKTPGQIDDMAIKTAFEETRVTAENQQIMSFLNVMMNEHEGLISTMGLGQWYDCGFPQIEMGAKFAASLLASDVTPDALAMVAFPWRSFLIEVPDGLLEIFDNHTSRQTPIRRILVTKLAGHPRGPWAYVAYTASTVSVWRIGVHPHDLLPANLEGEDIDSGTILLEQTDEDRRVNSLIGRLIINTCLTVTIPDLLKETGPGHASWTKAKKDPAKIDPGLLRSFRLGKPVTIDFRDRVKSYIRGERSSPDVRSLVRGHFKRQHYGVGNSEVKIIWREPFWRGEEGLPVVIRPHVVKL